MSEEERSQSIVNNVKKLIKCLSGAEVSQLDFKKLLAILDEAFSLFMFVFFS